MNQLSAITTELLTDSRNDVVSVGVCHSVFVEGLQLQRRSGGHSQQSTAALPATSANHHHRPRAGKQQTLTSGVD